MSAAVNPSPQRSVARVCLLSSRPCQNAATRCEPAPSASTFHSSPAVENQVSPAAAACPESQFSASSGVNAVTYLPCCRCGGGVGDEVVEGGRCGETELLELGLVVEVDEGAGVLREADDRVADLHAAERAGGVVLLVLLGFVGDVLQKSLDVQLGHLGVARLCEAGAVARLDVGLELEDHVAGLAVELRRLHLDVGVVRVPAVHDLGDGCHPLAIGEPVHVLDGDGLVAVPGVPAVTARARCQAEGGNRSDRGDRGDTGETRGGCHAVLLFEVMFLRIALGGGGRRGVVDHMHIKSENVCAHKHGKRQNHAEFAAQQGSADIEW